MGLKDLKNRKPAAEQETATLTELEDSILAYLGMTRDDLLTDEELEDLTAPDPEQSEPVETETSIIVNAKAVLNQTLSDILNRRLHIESGVELRDTMQAVYILGQLTE